MARKKIGIKGFADMLVESSSKASVLDEMTEIIDFCKFKKLFESSDQTKTGRPSYPPEAMLKVILLQVLYTLSDERMEEALSDRLSFRRFCGFSIEDRTPDNATICRFRLLLQELDQDLLEEVNKQLDARGMRLRHGTLVDATIIQANAKPPQGGEVSLRDPQAGWTQKAGKYHFGYKAHIGMDQTSGLINKVKVTSADIHDSLATYECLDEGDKKVYADKAYDNDAMRKNLRESKIKPRLMHRTYSSDRKETKERKAALNKAYGKIRCSVEKFFGTIKRSYGARQARYLGIEKNQVNMDIMAICYNLRRAVTIAKALKLQPA